jgi:hypothetical protein
MPALAPDGRRPTRGNLVMIPHEGSPGGPTAPVARPSD